MAVAIGWRPPTEERTRYSLVLGAILLAAAAIDVGAPSGTPAPDQPRRMSAADAREPMIVDRPGRSLAAAPPPHPASDLVPDLPAPARAHDPAFH